MNMLIYPLSSCSSSFTVHVVSGNWDNDDPLLKDLWEGWVSEDEDFALMCVKINQTSHQQGFITTCVKVGHSTAPQAGAVRSRPNTTLCLSKAEEDPSEFIVLFSLYLCADHS